jgi:hypothetical protein
VAKCHAFANTVHHPFCEAPKLAAFSLHDPDRCVFCLPPHASSHPPSNVRTDALFLIEGLFFPTKVLITQLSFYFLPVFCTSMKLPSNPSPLPLAHNGREPLLIPARRAPCHHGPPSAIVGLTWVRGEDFYILRYKAF